MRLAEPSSTKATSWPVTGPHDSARLQKAPSRLGEVTFQCSGGDEGQETPPWCEDKS